MRVTKIVSMRIESERDVCIPAAVEPNNEAWWKKVRVGTMVLFWTRSNVQSWLSMMEVTNVNGDEQELTGCIPV